MVQATPPSSTVTFTSESGDHLTIRVSGWLYPDLDTAREANALTGEISLRAGAFRGRFHAHLRTWDFAELRDQLRRLLRTPRSEAVFQTHQQAIELVMRGDGRGAFTIAGKATDDIAWGNRLLFEFFIDTARLERTLAELDAVMRRYPARLEPAVPVRTH
ncbi:WapI family immunity protein [Arenimonas composti]|uniref:Uncharacterized protein n=1 Tax=Arenimonas composti TR7-09 = DSM 18010 TaxID=1121013 RepID=A0A091B973_9GAMM|nr:hypothetical protein [Arenimonas composti]KFN49213.1 hypothetical protein P873_12215 [Arenimonas composti TR7-09 = DSM 18010]